MEVRGQLGRDGFLLSPAESWGIKLRRLGGGKRPESLYSLDVAHHMITPPLCCSSPVRQGFTRLGEEVREVPRGSSLPRFSQLENDQG